MQEIAIKSWLAGKTIFVTGATGFLGKVLIEKVLRDCENVCKVYILIRAQTESELKNRFTDFRENVIFKRIHESKPDLMDKLHPVRGDLSKVNLGINESDKNCLITEVDVVLHSGASVKFEETMNDAVIMNVRGTREMITLARSMMNLKSFVYVSTAYSNCNLKFIEEKVYPTLYEPNMAIELCERNCGKTIEEKVLKIYPNTYVFSKKLAEKLIFDFQNDLPLCIVRPSIISPACREPYPGWVDSKNGPMGFLIGAGSGFIRSAHGNRWNIVDLLPVDYAANGVIAAAVNIGQNKIEKCPVYNLAASGDVPISWHQLIEGHKEIILENPFSRMLWYPGGALYRNFYCYLLFFVLFQLIPSCFCDILFYLIKRRTWFVSMQLKTYRKLKLFSFFVKKSWRWDTSNTVLLYNKLKISERYCFNFRTHHMDIRKYFRDWHYGTRKYLLHINEHATESEIKQLKFFYYLDLILKTAFCSYIAYWFVNYFGYSQSLPILHFSTCGTCSSVRNEFQSILFSVDQKL